MLRLTKQTLAVPRRVAVIGVATVCMLSAAACGGNKSDGSGGGSDEPIYLGGALSLTGKFASFEVPAFNGLKVGVDEVNAKGGVLGGRKFVLNVEDTGSDATKVAPAAQKVLSDHKVTFMAPEVVGDLAKSVLRFTTQRKIISMSSGNVAGLDDPKTYPYHFMLYPAPDKQLNAYVAGVQQLGGTNVRLAIITDTESADLQLSDQVSAAVKAAGGEVVSRSEVPNDATDLTVQVRKAQQAGANVLFMRSVAGVCTAAANAVNSIGWTSVKLLATTACVNSAVFGAVPPAIAANYYGMSDRITTRPEGSNVVRSEFADYVTALKKYGAVTNLEVSANYTDAVRMLAWAIEKTGSTDGDKLKAALETLATTPLPAGTTVWTVSPGWSSEKHTFLGDLTHWWALAQPGANVDGTYQGVELTVKY
jgi:branched-chain amino acid transport system substrate-binding protein